MKIHKYMKIYGGQLLLFRGIPRGFMRAQTYAGYLFFSYHLPFPSYRTYLTYLLYTRINNAPQLNARSQHSKFSLVSS